MFKKHLRSILPWRVIFFHIYRAGVERTMNLYSDEQNQQPI